MQSAASLRSKFMRTHYETLGITRDASEKRVKASYRTLVKTCHPDRFPEGSKEYAEADKRIREIYAAYAVLSKPVSRASYDAKLNTRALPRQDSEPRPAHCAKCGKPTTYWHTPGKVALCHVCAEKIV
jgi:curved DNA-binding protein CbpA